MKQPHYEYFLCTDGDLKRLLFNLRKRDCDYSRREIAKVIEEIARREKIGRNPIIQEFRKKIK